MIEDEIKKAVEGLAAIGETVRKSIEPLNKALSSITKTIVNFFDRFKTEKYSEEEINFYKKIYEQYGNYGWSIPFNTEWLFNKDPKSLKSADNRLYKYCTKKYMNDCFSYILLDNYVNKEDFEEALSCYRKKLYKSCILTLYSLIDSLVIKLQKPKAASCRKKAGTFSALDNAIKNNDENYIFYVCRFIATYQCLKTLFENANGFRVQPKLPNRNFIVHGMLARDITKKDCIKVFILLQNMCFMIKHLKLKLYD